MPPRIFLASNFAAGEVVALPKAESRHVQVLRLQPGDAVVLFNGDDGTQWPGEIVRMGRSEVEVRLGSPESVDRELPIRVILALGIPANERMDALVEKATELGVAAIQPLVCERSVVRLSGDRAETRREHWRAVAASASEQCGRVRVPQIGVPVKLDAWLRGLPVASAHAEHRVVLSLDRSAASPLTLWPGLFASATTDLMVLSGPEGGLAPSEESAAVECGFARIGLGPRVLRADTAPLALLAWLGIAAAARSP
jgi:16S rRNA (uracil1498-N3)-methyltransferase